MEYLVHTQKGSTKKHISCMLGVTQSRRAMYEDKNPPSAARKLSVHDLSTCSSRGASRHPDLAWRMTVGSSLVLSESKVEHAMTEFAHSR